MLDPTRPEMIAEDDVTLIEIERACQRFPAQRPDIGRPFWPVALASMAAGAGLFVAGAVVAFYS